MITYSRLKDKISRLSEHFRKPACIVYRIRSIILLLLIPAMALMISCTGTPQEDSEEVSGEASEKVASEDSPAPSEERLYQNPPEYVQISNTISTHGLDYYTSPVLVDNNSTKEDHIEALIETAYKYKGDPFIEGKSGPPGEGVDCSGLIMQACYGAGVDLWPSNPARHETQEYLWECAEIAEMDTLKTVPVKAWLIPGLCIGMSYLLNNVALSLTEATSVAFIRSLSVLITPVFAFLVYHTHYRWQHMLLQILVIPGLYLLCVRGGLSGFGKGEAVTLAAAILTAGALVFSKNYLEMVDPVSMTALQGGCSAVLAMAGCMFFEKGLHLENTTGTAWLIILYLAILCTFLGYLMQNLSLTRISERSVSLLQSLCPVMTAFFSFILLGERLSAAGIAGAAIIIACVIASTVMRGDESETTAVKENV